MRKRVFIYALKCLEDKYYVGKSFNPGKRIQAHFNGHGAAWTQKYLPIEVDMIIDGDVYDEDKYTLEYMDHYGIENVRGGVYCQLVLPDYHIKTLNEQLRNYRDLCFKCDESGHFSRNCPNITPKD